MSFLRAVGAGAAGAAILNAPLVWTGVGWDLPEPFWRERAIVAALSTLACGWVAATLATLRARFSALRGDAVAAAFWCGAALALAPWSWLALAPASVLLVLALRGALPNVKTGPCAAIGGLLHLAPAAIFFLIAPDASPLPFSDRPAPLAARSAPPADSGPTQQRPDVLLIVADTLRADAVLDPELPTPHLDALRVRGAWADFALAPCNQTLPSHMVLFTGLDVEKLGMRSNDSRWPTANSLREDWNVRTLAERLRDAGWRTAGVAANVLLTSAPIVEGREPAEREMAYDLGFEWWHGMQRVDAFGAVMEWSERRTLFGWLLPRRLYSWPLNQLLNPTVLQLERTHWREGERAMDLAQDALRQLHAQPEPGFLFLNLFDPHAPYHAPPPHAGSLAPAAAAPGGYAAGLRGAFDMLVAMYDAFEAERAPDFAGPLRDLTAEAAHLHRLYREEVAYTDALVGRLLEQAERSGRPTLILFVGDHGEAFGEHRNAEHRWTLHDEELRVPFILAGPGVPAGLHLRQTPELVDGTRTLLELLGLADAAVGGRNVLTSDDVAPRAPLAMMPHRATLRRGRHKLIAWISYGEHADPRGRFERDGYELRPLQLFDLDADPGEHRNLLQEDGPQDPDARAALDLMLDELRARMAQDRFPLLPARVLSAKQAANLAALGYADGLTE